jgi:hypothetical protein
MYRFGGSDHPSRQFDDSIVADVILHPITEDDDSLRRRPRTNVWNTLSVGVQLLLMEGIH